ncbi:hypothetical protein PAHA111176_20165 [Parendozoicomonas haliclonae]|uniref:Uncharacterized protein n=1 Tax=Parendozoicomonas haliclonae TaxID=1960125 RepID=A0A1X7AFJ0_9GAMM|nr:hypothetical protein EHSB41UT_00782 [Parendozoicomonas haliclonae]
MVIDTKLRSGPNHPLGAWITFDASLNSTTAARVEAPE